MDLQGSSDSSKTPCGTDQKSVHDLLRREKKDGLEIKQAKERTMAKPIPFMYENKNSNAKVSQFSIKNTDADGKKNKEDYLIFKNGTQNKVLIQIQTIEQIFKGAQTAQRHLVELTRNQFTIRLEVKEKKDRAEIPASEKYENNFAKKAEKLAKEEKETKKKVSIKNGKKSVYFMTPMVKIREEYQDLEYESDDEED
jgi:hypothetical protein